MTQEPQDTALSELLGQLRDEPTGGQEAFTAALHRRLVAAGPPPASGIRERLTDWLGERPWLVGSACGGAAGVAAFLLMGALTGVPAPEQPQALAVVGQQGGTDAAAQPPRQALAPAAAGLAVECEPAPAQAHAEVFVVPQGQVALVQLHFAVDRGVDEAEFSVLLPAGLAFFSDGEALPERAFHWVAPLAKGDNEVPVAIVGEHPGLHRVTATATIDGEVVVHEVVLEVREAV